MPRNGGIDCGWGRDIPILCRVIGDGFADVLASAQDGSEAAFSRLWRDANPALLRYLRVIAGDAADDVAAETWVQVVRGLAGFSGDEAAWWAWLFTVARRRAIDVIRRSARHPQAPLDDLPAARHPLSPDPADEVLEHLGTGTAIALLHELPRLQAEVILLRVVAGLDTASVARLVGRSPGAVRVAAHRGLRQLAQNLTAERVTP